MSQDEKSVHPPDYVLLKKFAEVLGVPTAYFFCESDELAELVKSFRPSE